MKTKTKARVVEAACAALALVIFFAALPALAARGDLNPPNDGDEFYLFYSLACARCRDAREFAGELRSRYPGIVFRELEVVKSRENQEIFDRLAEKLGITTPGVPVFVYGSSHRVGFKEGDAAKSEIVAMIERELEGRPRGGLDAGLSPGDMPPRTPLDDQRSPGAEPTAPQNPESRLPRLRLPFMGTIDPKSLSLPALTLFIGILDGVNPCALWVLMLLLSLVANAGSRRRMVAVGSVFIFFSAALYFAFMAAWFNFFALLGLKSVVTTILGVCVCAIGIVNAKEIFRFKKGVSLAVPEGVKPELFKRMRRVVSSPSGFLLVAGTASLAFLANLAEFGCTVGFPAIYTRVLALQRVGLERKYLFMALYNVVYVVPLAAVFALFVLTLGKYRLTERLGKTLKVVTGLVMLAIGLLLVFKPEYLAFS